MLWIVAIAGLVVGYFIGAGVGFSAGVDRGRQKSDREWALWVEHGAAPTPEVGR